MKSRLFDKNYLKAWYPLNSHLQDISKNNNHIVGVTGQEYYFIEETATLNEAFEIVNSIENTGVTLSNTQKTAIEDFVFQGINNGWWNKMVALYGFLGESAAANAINWKKPGTYNIDWSGSVTHNTNGIVAAGGYGNTNINAEFFLENNGELHVSFYNKLGGVSDNFFIGCLNSSYGQVLTLLYAPRYGKLRLDAFQNINAGADVNPKGLIYGCRRSDGNKQLYLNGASIFGPTAGNGYPQDSEYIIIFNSSGTPILPTVVGTTCGLASIGKPLDDAELINFNGSVSTLMEQLGRNYV